MSNRKSYGYILYAFRMNPTTYAIIDKHGVTIDWRGEFSTLQSSSMTPAYDHLDVWITNVRVAR